MSKTKQDIIALLTGLESSKRNYYTELKKHLRQIEKKNMQLEIINQVVKSFNVDMSLDDMLENVADKLKEIFALDCLSLSLFENDQLIVSNFFPRNQAALLPGTVLQPDRSLCWKVINDKQACYHTAPSTDGDIRYLEETIFISSQIAETVFVPLFSKNRPIGVLSVGSASSGAYNDSDLLFLQQVADQLAVCIENARLYNEVLQSKREWERTFSAVTDMLLYVDLDFRVVRFNQAVLEFLGLAEEFVYGRKCHELLQPPSHDWSSCPLTECYRTKQTVYQQLPLIGNRICDVFAYPILAEDSAIYGVILYIKDVTKKLHIEAQLIQSGKLAAIGEMAAGVAHELNNPLTAILGNTQLLLRESEKESLDARLLDDIFTSGKRCKLIIQNLLTFSRQEEYMFEPCSLNQAVQQVLSLVRYQIERNHISFTLELESNLPPIEGNIQQIEQIIINLLLNAKDAILTRNVQAGHIHIRTETKEKKGQPHIFMHITDNGCGIEDKNKSEIFNPFFTTKAVAQGTGLGLSVSLGIARAHGGTIEAESEKNQGSRFTLILPACSSNHPDSIENREESQ